MIFTQHGKEIEADNNCLMDEIFRNFNLMSENYIKEDQIEKYFLATHEEKIVGFLAVGYCDRAVILQVADEAQRMGVGGSLVKFAVRSGATGAWRPRQDGCEKFWEKLKNWAADQACDARS